MKGISQKNTLQTSLYLRGSKVFKSRRVTKISKRRSGSGRGGEKGGEGPVPESKATTKDFKKKD